jgi:hypothetical protein
MQTFRMPRGLVAFLKTEAALGHRDTTAQVVLWLEGLRSYFGLPAAATALLERDRKKLGMDRYEYMLHALYQRSLALLEQDPGFDGPQGAPGPRRPGSLGADGDPSVACERSA